MVVTCADWERFMNQGIEPQLPGFIMDSWRLYRQHRLPLDSKLFPRLSADEFRNRYAKVGWFLDRVDELIRQSRLSFQGLVHFFDMDCYQLYSRVVNCEDLESMGQELTGCRLMVETAGNGIHNLAVRLKQPITLGYYEHASAFMHPFAGYAEPVVINGKMVGALGVYIREMHKATEAQLLARSVTRLLVESCLLERRQSPKRSDANRGFNAKHSFTDLSYVSVGMKVVVNRSQQVSKSDYPVLIHGESGTGKEYLAHAIHNASPRRYGPFIAVNCASLSHSLTESELFGYAEGAFTGAVKGGRRGKIEQADGGTLFLDEVGDLPPGAQAMLLRTLQDHELSRIGDEKVIPLDFRVICATNKDLRQLCAEKLFRWDLYYRLAGVTITLPPLRDRPEDIPVMVEHLLSETNQEQGRDKRFSTPAVQLLQEYSWPGNIRELRNIVKTSHLLSQGDEIDRGTIADLLHIQDFVEETIESNEYSGNSRKELFVSALKRTDGNVATAAKQSGISRATGYRWLKELEVDKERGR